jgi:hypothetical protein
MGISIRGIDLRCSKALAVSLFSSVKGTNEVQKLGNIEIWYRNPPFLSFFERTLQILSERDTLSFARVENNIGAIVETQKDACGIGRAIGVVFEHTPAEDLEQVGPVRYAALLARHAADIRIIRALSFAQRLRSAKGKCLKALKIAVGRELYCAQRLGCSQVEVRIIRDWLDEH